MYGISTAVGSHNTHFCWYTNDNSECETAWEQCSVLLCSNCRLHPFLLDDDWTRYSISGTKFCKGGSNETGRAVGPVKC